MKLTDYLTLAHRYKIDRQPQSAWPLEEIEQVFETITKEGNVISEIALAWKKEDEISEYFPYSNPDKDDRFSPKKRGLGQGIHVTFYTTYLKETFERNWEEEWKDFVIRSREWALAMPADLISRLKEDPHIHKPEETQILCRVSWAGPIEWQERFGLNLIKLIEGEINHPETGKDQSGITWQFHYPNYSFTQGRTDEGATYYLSKSDVPEAKAGRRIFRKAEEICANLDTIKPRLFDFLITERKKILPQEQIIPDIISIKLQYNDDWENISAFASLNDTNPENDPLYQYWKVEILNFETFRMIG